MILVDFGTALEAFIVCSDVAALAWPDFEDLRGRGF